MIFDLELEEPSYPIQVKNGRWEILGNKYSEMNQEQKDLLRIHLNNKREI